MSVIYQPFQIRIFISYDWSYRRQARNLASLLRIIYGDKSVWFDTGFPEEQNPWDVVKEEIERCDIFIVLLSHDTLSSSYCTRQHEAAKSLNKKFILVAVRPGIVIPPDNELSKIKRITINEQIDVKAFNELQSHIINAHRTRLLPKRVRIFISYSRKDIKHTKHFASWLNDVYDEDTTDQIPAAWYDHEIHAGEDWWKRIANEIGKRDIFLYLLSNDSINSPNCQAEFVEAKRLGKQILPIIVREGTIPSPELQKLQYLSIVGGSSLKNLASLHAAILRNLTRSRKDRSSTLSVIAIRTTHITELKHIYRDPNLRISHVGHSISADSEPVKSPDEIKPPKKPGDPPLLNRQNSRLRIYKVWGKGTVATIIAAVVLPVFLGGAALFNALQGNQGNNVTPTPPATTQVVVVPTDLPPPTETLEAVVPIIVSTKAPLPSVTPTDTATLTETPESTSTPSPTASPTDQPEATAAATDTPEPPTPIPCTNTLPSRLKPNDVGIATFAAIDIYAEPGTYNAVIRRLNLNEVFIVLEGPQCLGSNLWYRVLVNEIVGWIPEGDGASTYYVALLTTPTHTPTPVPSPTATDTPTVVPPTATEVILPTAITTLPFTLEPTATNTPTPTPTETPVCPGQRRANWRAGTALLVVNNTSNESANFVIVRPRPLLEALAENDFNKIAGGESVTIISSGNSPRGFRNLTYWCDGRQWWWHVETELGLRGWVEQSKLRVP